jgi:hypothetical protein
LQLRASVPTYAVLFPSLSPLYLSYPLSLPLLTHTHALSVQ